MQYCFIFQVAKIRKLLKRIEELNEATFKANLAAPMARHELMTLLAEQVSILFLIELSVKTELTWPRDPAVFVNNIHLVDYFLVTN